MRIGIDIDGTLTEIDKWTLACGQKEGYQVKQYAYDAKDTFALSKEEADYFWDKYLDLLFTQVEVKTNASEVIKKFKEKGHEIYLITARSNLDIPISKSNKLDVARITIDWLKKNDIYYNHLEMACFNKDIYCIKNNIDIMIEDSPTNIIKVSKVIPVICMDCSYNKNIYGPNIKRVYNWNEIESIID